MNRHKEHKSIVIANVIYFIIMVSTMIFAFMNRNGKYKNYFMIPLIVVGLRYSIRLLDFEKSLAVIGKD